MLKRALKLLVVASIAVGMASAAENPFIGGWKLNSGTAGIVHNSILLIDVRGSNRSVLFDDPQRSALAVSNGLKIRITQEDIENSGPPRKCGNF